GGPERSQAGTRGAAEVGRGDGARQVDRGGDDARHLLLQVRSARAREGEPVEAGGGGVAEARERRVHRHRERVLVDGRDRATARRRARAPGLGDEAAIETAAREVNAETGYSDHPLRD